MQLSPDAPHGRDPKPESSTPAPLRSHAERSGSLAQQANPASLTVVQLRTVRSYPALY